MHNTQVALNFYTYCPVQFPSGSANVTVTHPAPASFTFTGSDAITLGVAPYTYQWQTGVDGTTFVNLSEGGVYSGVTTNTLHISDTTGLSQPPNGGTFYRCIVIGADGGKIASDYTFLRVL